MNTNKNPRETAARIIKASGNIQKTHILFKIFTFLGINKKNQKIRRETAKILFGDGIIRK